MNIENSIIHYKVFANNGPLNWYVIANISYSTSKKFYYKSPVAT